MTLPTAERSVVTRRPDYLPSSPQEEFIVPLLRDRIGGVLVTYATPAPQHGKVLDVGCGRQPFRKRLESIGYGYTGLDVEQNAEGTVDLIHPLDQPFPTGANKVGPFNFILCTEVLEHVADWRIAFRNLFLLTAPSGRVLITCPHFYQLHEEPYDFWRPTLHALRYFADQEGFRVLHAEAAGDAWDVLGTLLANCSPYATSGRFIDRVLGKVVREGCKSVFTLLRKRWLQNRLKMSGPLYLANIVVLEKR